MSDSQQRVTELLSVFGDPHACAAHLLCDRHHPDVVAFTIVEPDLTSRDLTFGELRDSSARFATALSGLGVGPGDRVATLMGKSAELVVAMLAIWRLGAIQVPLFTAFAPAAIATRILGRPTKVVITDPSQRAKLNPGDEIPPDPGWRVVTTGSGSPGDLEFEDLLGADPYKATYAGGGDTTLIELFTSGTTGAPKGVPVPLRAVAAFLIYQKFGLDHQPDDVFWNAADPGWAYGLYFAIVGPLAAGSRSLLLNSGFGVDPFRRTGSM